ncbi:hypothetical protein [Alkalihalobacillus sp. 1P02AB]|uniref:hypothetical protein n=1 Tax=Alkalihalobacillus sp. 1P02AB TaxID=3132260 RepID=UPI0039A4C198
MPSINLFKNSTVDDFSSILNNLGEPILINDTESIGVVATPTQSRTPSDDDRYITTKDKISRGDVIKWRDREWLILNEVVAAQKESYKSLMRHLAHTLNIQIGMNQGEIIGYDSLGRPIYSDPEPIYAEIGVLAEAEKQVAGNGSIRLVDGNIKLIAPDNEQSRLVEVNHTYTIGNIEYRIYGIDPTETGLLLMYSEKK